MGQHKHSCFIVVLLRCAFQRRDDEIKQKGSGERLCSSLWRGGWRWGWEGGYLTPPPVRRSRWSGPGPLKCLFVSDYKLQRRPPRFPPQRSHKSASAALFSPRAPFFAIKIGRWCVYLKHFIIIFFRLFLLIQLKWHHSVKDNIIKKQLLVIVIYLMKYIASDSIQPESNICEITGLIRNLI